MDYVRAQIGLYLLLGACSASTGPHSSTAPAAAPEANASASMPTLDEIRDEVAAAVGQPPAPHECDEWLEQLRALWQRDPPAYIVALLDAGSIAAWCGRPDVADEFFEQVATDGPRWARAEAWLGRARLRRAEGDDDEALEALRAAHRADRRSVEVRLLMAHVLADRFAFEGDGHAFDDAEALYRKAILAPRREIATEARIGLARLYVLLPADDARVDEGLLLLTQTPRDASPALQSRVHTVRAIHQLADDGPSAARSLAHAVKLDPSNREAWAHLGILRVSTRDYGPALEALSRAQLDPRFEEHAAVLRARANALIGMNDLTRAEMVFDRLAALRPADASVRYDRAHLAELWAAQTDDEMERERYLADAARHFRAFLQHSETAAAAAREHARAFLDDYVRVEAPEPVAPTPRTPRGRNNPIDFSTVEGLGPPSP